MYPEDVDLQQPTSPTENLSGKGSSRTKSRRGRSKRAKCTKPSASEKTVLNVSQGVSSQDKQISVVTESKSLEQIEESPRIEVTSKVRRRMV